MERFCALVGEMRPMRTSAALLAMPLVAASTSVALAGSEQAFDNRQPSLALALVTPSFGSFPDGSATKAEGATLGFVYDFAGAFAPGGALAANGQSFPFSSNPVLGTVFGGAFGGDFDNFNLPNLVGRAIVGAGGGRNLGAAIGSASVTLNPSQVPAPGEFVAAQPYSTVQPSLALTPLIAVNGASRSPPAHPERRPLSVKSPTTRGQSFPTAAPFRGAGCRPTVNCS